MICLDSDVIIDFFKKKKEAVELVEKNHLEIVTTEINVFEVFSGIYSKQQRKGGEEEIAEQFFQDIEILEFKKGCGKVSAFFLNGLAKSGKTIGQNDAFIAAIMARYGCKKIITRNRKHFSAIKGIEVISY